MLNLNLCLLAGRLTKDVELKATQGGKSYCSFTIAMYDDYTKKTNFVELEAWGNDAEYIANYHIKGDLLFFETRVQKKEWESNGEKRNKTIFVVNKVKTVEAKRNNNNNNQESTEPNGFEVVTDDPSLPF